jgi:hypothetical protein
MLSFIFFADGPCDESSWRINDDKSQWWSRRDALVRILGASLWQAPATANKTVSEVCFLFENQVEQIEKMNSSNSFCRPVVVHKSAQIVAACQIPYERELIKHWKKTFQDTSKVQIRLSVGSMKQNEKETLCSYYAWKEHAILNNVAGSAQNTTAATSAMPSIEALDKRELLKLLQDSCPLEFLREHGLNGSEALVLKKKNKQAVASAYHAWRTKATSSSTSANSSINGSMSAVNLCGSSVPVCDFDQLVATFAVVLQGMLGRTRTALGVSDGVLLLLHEDYPDELPVFGSDTAVCETQLCSSSVRYKR